MEKGTISSWNHTLVGRVHRHSIRVDRLTSVEGAKEGQLFGFKIEHANLYEIINKINSHSFYAVVKVGALPNYT